MDLLSTVLPGLASATDLHPLFVHFPVALWLTAAALYGLGVARDHEGARDAGRWVLYLGTLAGTLTLATGLQAAGRLGHDSAGHELVHVHRNLMIASFLLAAVASGLAFQAQRRRSAPFAWMATGTLLLCASTTILGADRGAHLVFGSGLGVSSAPPVDAPGLAPAPTVDAPRAAPPPGGDGHQHAH